MRFSLLRCLLLSAACLIESGGSAATILTGDHTVQSNGTEPGDLTINGKLSVYGNWVDVGTTADNDSALALRYNEEGSSVSVSLTATQPAAAFLWRDNAVDEVALKMKLSETNVLSLYNAEGAAAISLNPNSGVISLSGQNSGVTLSDGTQLRRAQDLWGKLVDAQGNTVVQVDPSGKLIVSAPAQFLQPVSASNGVTFASGVTLGQHNTAYLQQTLYNMGYRENSALDFNLTPVSPISVSATAVDGAGNTFLAGYYSGSGLVGTAYLNVTGSGTFVAKIGPDGVTSWVSALSGTSSFTSLKFGVDSSGRAQLFFRFSGSVSSGLPQTVTSLGSNDLLLCQFGTDGSVIRTRQFGGTGSETGTMAVSPAGHTLVTVSSGSGLTAGVPSPVGAGTYRILVDSSGAVAWVQASAWNEYGLDTAGNGYSVSLNGTQIRITKSDSSGATAWTRDIGSGSPSLAGFAVSADGNVYIGGTFSGSMTGLPQTLNSYGSSSNAFLIRLAPDGTVVWARALGGTSSVNVSRIAADSMGNAYLGGTFYGMVNGGVPEPFSCSGSYQDIYLAKFSSDGSVAWAHGYGWNGSESFSTFVAGPTGRLVLMGSCESRFTMGNQIFPPSSFLYIGSSDTLAPRISNAKLSWGSSKATSEGAVALGIGSRAAGLGSVALGSRTSSSGTSAFTAGDNTTASGVSSSAIGLNTTASGYASATFGRNTTASGGQAFAAGDGSTASGSNSAAFGLNTSAGGSYSIAGGYDTDALGEASVTFGYYTLASGQYSAAFGYETDATGRAATAFGSYTYASGQQAAAFGSSSMAYGYNSLAAGEGVTAQAFNSVAFGRYNLVQGNSTSWVATDDLFVIGNGTSSSARANAFQLKKNGDAVISGNLSVLGANNTLPNQTLTGSSSVLTRGLADSRYLAALPPGESLFTQAQADGRYLPLAAGASFLTAVAAGETYLKLETADSDFLRKSTASSIYLTSNSAAANYLAKVDAQSNYLPRSEASQTYLTEGGGDDLFLTQAEADSRYAYKATTEGAEIDLAHVAFGQGTAATGVNSMALGLNTKAQGAFQLVLGRYNLPQGDSQNWVPTDDVLVIGNGEQGNRSNSLTVKKNGDTAIQGKLVVNGEATLTRITPQGDVLMGEFGY